MTYKQEVHLIKNKCIERDGCWEWQGACAGMSEHQSKTPKVYSVDYRKCPQGTAKSVMTGGVAMWMAYTGLPLESGQVVWRTCGNDLCLNPAHLETGTMKQMGEAIAKAGRWKAKPARIAANRKIGQKLAALTQEQLDVIQNSDQTLVELKKIVGAAKSTICKARQYKQAYTRKTNIFGALM